MSKLKILVVDDNETIREIVQISLEDEWTVVTAASGAEAVQIAQAERPSLILLDRIMPGMDGLDTLIKLKEHESTRSIPVVFFTGIDHGEDTDVYKGLEVVGVVAKPFDPITLPGEITKIFDKL